MGKALVIAGGPQVQEQFKDARQFNGLIITVDKMLKPCLDAGIIPDYVMTIENISTFGYFFQDIPCNIAKKITVIVSERTHVNTEKIIKETGFKMKLFEWKYLNMISNVGLMAFIYTWSELKIKKIIIIGFDHCDYKKTGIPCFNENSEHFQIFYVKLENPYTKTICYLDPIHQLWREQFFDFLPKNRFGLAYEIINCTGDGALFGENIEWSHLNEHL